MDAGPSIGESLRALRALDYVLVIIPALLTLMGAIVLKPPKEKHPRVRLYRWLWFAAFCIVGLIGAGAGVYAIGKTRVEEQQSRNVLVEQLTGGTANCFFLAYEPNRYAPGPLWRLRAENPGSVAIVDVTLAIRVMLFSSDSEAEQLAKIRNLRTVSVGTVPTAGKDTGVALEPGSYQLDIQTQCCPN